MSMFYELMMKKKGMPSRYQEVEYIESTGTQYIDTGVSKEININCEMVVQSNDNLANKIIFGAESSGGQWVGTSGAYYSLGGGVDFSFSSTSKQTINFNIKYHDSISATIDAETKSRNFVSQGGQSANNYRIFGVGSALIPSCKIYSCIIKRENNSVLRNFIPVYDTETQKYGMWESVQGKFYGNDGTGDFIGSIVGYTVVGSPTITDGVVSGFTTSDYIEIAPKISTPDSIEFCTKLTIGTLGTVQAIVANNYTSNNGIALRTNGQCVVTVNDGGLHQLVSNINLVAGNTYIIKLKIVNGVSAILKILNTNGVEIDSVANNNFPYYFRFSTVNSIFYGYYSWSAFTGSIDLNETYIKVNNKLIFNGQQA